MPVTNNTNIPFDIAHLARQTMGDKKLEREIVALFAIQCANCEKSLNLNPNENVVYEIAHQMKGCAMSVGAGQIVQIAGKLENDPGNRHAISQLRDLCRSAKEYIDLPR